MSNPLIINCAMTGMVPTSRDTPFVPVTAKQIIEDAVRCHAAGASILHLHSRNADESPAWERDSYVEIIAGIRQAVPDPDIIVCTTTSGRVHNTLPCRSDVLNLEDGLKPDMASLTLGSMNFPKQASVNSPEMIAGLAGVMAEKGIKPELEAFDIGMVEYSHYLIRKGILSGDRPYFNVLLGSLGTLSASPRNLAAIVDALPEGAVWAATGIGQFQFPVQKLAVAMGGHVRVGLEDGIFMDAGKTTLATNAGMVDRIVRVADAMERPIARPREVRAVLGLPLRSVGECNRDLARVA
ncbi:MAG: 3-keto-5-aminohexanoate cleavage protein [Armatimonadota bacterium]